MGCKVKKTKNYIAIFPSAFIALLFVFSPLNAQFQLSNPSFETFETGFNSVGQQPTGWKGSNVSQSAPIVGTITKQLVNSETAGRSGNCVYLHNEDVGVQGIAMAPAPAFIALGTPWNQISGTDANSAIGGCTGGLAFTHRPDTVAIWVKRTYSNAESAHVMLYLWSGTSQGASYRNKGGNCSSSSRTNDETDIRATNSCSTTQLANLIGQGEWTSNQQINDWTLVKFPINYNNNSIPENVNVIISAANYPCEGCASSIKAGSKLWADDISLIYSSKAEFIKVNNRNIADFDPNILEYTHSLGTNATTIPPISVFRNGRELLGAEITINYGTIGGAPTIITINAEDGSSSTTYTVHFVNQLSINPRPETIKINGTPIQGFNGYVTSYDVALPYGTTTCPEIAVEIAEDGQTFVVNNCTSVPGGATVTVTAPNTAYSTTYTLNFTVAQLNDNKLQNILINGEPIPNFNPSTNSYTVELPLGTTVAPTITPVSAYPTGAQTILLTDNGLASPSTILVSSPAATASRTYKITYVITMSSNTSLQDIKIGGVSIDNFNSQTYNYSYVLPRGTTILPAITWTKGEANQTVTATYNGVNGETRLVVTAQNGSSVQIYRIAFSVARS
ncbi:MAG: hypothetical protein LBV75_03325, partial [Paludibacter sp.]|nr:hypothetical protein [Paludibacter sp.]